MTAIQQAAAKASTSPNDAAVWSRTKRSSTATQVSEDATGTGQAPVTGFSAGVDASRASACKAARSGVVAVAGVGSDDTRGSLEPTPPGAMPDITTPVSATASSTDCAEDAAGALYCADVAAPRCTGSASAGTASGTNRISGSRNRWCMRQVGSGANEAASFKPRSPDDLSVSELARRRWIGWAGIAPRCKRSRREVAATTSCSSFLYSARCILC